MAWYNASWPYRVKITVLASKVDADLTDFPVYVNLNDLPSGFHSNCNQTDGRDIRVTTSDGTTEVPREVVFYTAASDTGELHFKGYIDGDDNTDFYIYYGNSSASEPSVSDTYGRNNVWSDYQIVYHMNESSGNLTDSSGNIATTTTRTGTVYGNSTKIGKGLYITDVNDGGINVGSYTALTNHTVSLWANLDSYKSTYNMIFTIGSDYHAFQSTSATTRTAYKNGAGTTVYGNLGVGYGLSTSNWHLYSLVYTISGSNVNLSGYHDGAYFNALTGTAGYTPTAITAIGHRSGALQIEGYIDEFRLAKRALASTWLSTEYNNQNSPSTFFTIGTQEDNISNLNLLSLTGVGK